MRVLKKIVRVIVTGVFVLFCVYAFWAMLANSF